MLLLPSVCDGGKEDTEKAPNPISRMTGAGQNGYFVFTIRFSRSDIQSISIANMAR